MVGDVRYMNKLILCVSKAVMDARDGSDCSSDGGSEGRGDDLCPTYPTGWHLGRTFSVQSRLAHVDGLGCPIDARFAARLSLYWLSLRWLEEVDAAYQGAAFYELAVDFEMAT